MMINFFRKIRKKLADDNKPLKYLRYAIGEIALVVIGILIALSINNWNQNHKNEIEAQSIRNALLTDLTRDTVQLKSRIELIKSHVTETTLLFDRFKTASNLEDVIMVIREFDPVVFHGVSYNDATYTSIIASGKLELLEDELKIAMLENRKFQNDALETTTINTYYAKLIDYTSKYDWFDYKQYNPYVSKVLRTIDDERDLLSRFRVVIQFQAFMLPSYLSRYERSLESTKSLIQLIKDDQLL